MKEKEYVEIIVKMGKAIEHLKNKHRWEVIRKNIEIDVLKEIIAAAEASKDTKPSDETLAHIKEI